jgi:hypothetical protein
MVELLHLFAENGLTRCPSSPRGQSRLPRVFAPPEDPRFLPSEKSRLTAPRKPIPGLSAQA